MLKEYACCVGHVKAVHEGIKYNCDQCDYTAIQKRLSIIHKQYEHEEMKCDKCEYKKVAKNILLRHKQYEHEVIKNRPGKIVCSQRSIPFTSSWVHRFHQRSEHEGVTYDCDQCDYNATQQIHLAQHKQCKHEGVKYKFDQCDYEGTSQFIMRRHKKAEHEGNQSYRTECRICLV